MPVVTSIKPQRNGKRVNVYLDGKFGFGIDLDNFVRLGLRVEQELTEDEIEKIVKKAEFQKTCDKLLKFATLRLRSEKEINDWLKRKKVHESLYKDLISRLTNLDLVDDEKFARWWVEQRMSFRPKPKRILRQELKIKGINENVIADVLESITLDETKMVKELIEKKSYRWKNLPKNILRLKMSEFLARKGFAWDIIEKVTKKV